MSEWGKRCPVGDSGSENNRVAALAAETGLDAATIASAGGSALPPAGTRRPEVLEAGQAPAGVAHSTISGDSSEGSPRPSSRSPLKSYDFILAGDVLYKQCLLDPFLGTVRDMLAPGGRMLLCHVPRAGVTYDIVERGFVQAGFAFEILNGDQKKRSGEGCSEGGHGPEGSRGAGIAAETALASRCDTTAVGGVDLCVDDARRARLYEVYSVG